MKLHDCKTTEAQRQRDRLRHAAKGYSGRTAKCEACGEPCPPAHRDRKGYKPPNACGSTCAERAIHNRIKRGDRRQG